MAKTTARAEGDEAIEKLNDAAATIRERRAEESDMTITATVPDCTMCGMTWAQACEDAEKAGRQSTGWATLHGPHGRHDSRCCACNVQAKQDGEIARLRHIIGEAREELRIPSDPDCEACRGTARIHGGEEDYWRSGPCDCHAPYPIAVARHKREVQAEADRRAMFERDHGHPYDDGCKPGCPVEF